MNLFTKKDRNTFSYWFAHWCAYQMVAILCHAWKFKYLFHDIEKPFLMLLWKDYKRVQKFHRTHANHHLTYKGKIDYEAVIIDWECSRFTKLDSPMCAADYILDAYSKNKITLEQVYILQRIVRKFNLCQ